MFIRPSIRPKRKDRDARLIFILNEDHQWMVTRAAEPYVPVMPWHY